MRPGNSIGTWHHLTSNSLGWNTSVILAMRGARALLLLNAVLRFSRWQCVQPKWKRESKIATNPISRSSISYTVIIIITSNNLFVCLGITSTQRCPTDARKEITFIFHKQKLYFYSLHSQRKKCNCNCFVKDFKI